MIATPRFVNGLPMVLATVYAMVPLFPAFIKFAGVEIPGVVLLPTRLTLVVLGLMALFAAYGSVTLLVAPRTTSPLTRPLLIWLCAALLGAAAGFDPLGGLLFLVIFGMGLVWHLGLYRYYTLPGLARAITWSIALSTGVASAIAIVMLLLHRPVLQYEIANGRAVGTFILPGELAGYLLIMLPTLLGIAAVTRQRALRIAACSAFLIGTLAFILTFSRTGFVAGGCALGAFILMRAGSRALPWAVGIAVAAFVAVLLIFNAHHDPSENYTRLSIWHAAIGIINRFPLTGVGPFQFARLYAVVRAPDGDAVAFHAHSVYLTLFAETGILGLAAFAWVWLRFAQLMRAALEQARPTAALLACAICAGLVGTLVQGLIDTVSVVIFALWVPTMAFALLAARHGLLEETQ